MWYPPQQQQRQQQQQRWHGYNRHLSAQPPPQQQQQSYPRTSYYCSSDESLTPNRATTTYVVSRHDENELFHHYHSTRADDVYGTGTDHYVTASTSSYSDEMSSSSLPYQSPNTHWNPIIAAPSKPSPTANSINQTHLTHTTPSSSSSPPSAACWDWLLYPPDVYSHLYRPSSSFTQQPSRDEDFALLANLPGWLLVLLYPSLKFTYSTDDENDSDQEISSLHNHSDEPSLSMNIDSKITHVSSNLPLSSENTLNEQKLPHNRSSTPDTDDGYQSASDASRSDYSQQSSKPYEQQHSKGEPTINVSSSPMPRRISYAAAAKPLPAPVMTSKTSALPTPIIKTKNASSILTANELLSTTGQKPKFTAPRFERMHHAKQYPSPTSAATTTTTSKDSPSSSSSSSFSNRATARSNNNHHQRNAVPHSTRRR